MSVAIITGSAGLVGSESVTHFAAKGIDVVGIDNGMRRQFFGEEASTAWMRDHLTATVPHYTHCDVDIRDEYQIPRIFERYGRDIALVIHAASQPSHDWAAREPIVDFTVNANGTLVLLEAARQSAPDAAFIFVSTNKVYGDAPNQLPFLEMPTRWEIDPAHPYAAGIPETMPIDQSMHSLFGVSKTAADLLVQEYGRYFGMKTATFRGGCLTGPNHASTRLHGFLAYLMKCTATGIPYTVLGYKRKQVRDNICSHDLVRAFDAFVQNPRCGEVYNIGGGRYSNCSMMEAIALCEEISGNQLQCEYVDQHRQGDHIWWISDVSRFQQHYPNWQHKYDVPAILQEIYEMNLDRWRVVA